MARGEFAVRVEKELKSRGDEIGQLGRSFDDMARHVEALLEAQQRLLRDISHELRSPLARLNVALALARQRAGEEAQGALARIEKEAETLNELIGRLLSLARVEADLGKVHTVPEDLVALVREVAADADFEARACGCTVRFEAAEALPPLLLNADLVRSAVENVVRNALRHTAPETEVEVAVLPLVENGGRWGLVRIRDHGPGVPEEELENLFRLLSPRRLRGRESGGVGSARMPGGRLQLHGGRIEAMNVPRGGLCVELRFPEGSEGLDGTSSGQTA
jgi:two-component system sensor histidine kinase CpxA